MNSALRLSSRPIHQSPARPHINLRPGTCTTLPAQQPTQRTSAFVAMTCVAPEAIPTIDAINCGPNGTGYAANNKGEFS
ncbi:hypothetical protein [Pseudomonas akapageensis]|uniref:hypothetical protein n=1 Tax=Pseudomonas akapageensis TaxID=2609961 RepID=UPI0014088775|nr:hypothetical protein [Pseudomonas akapageensis]